MTGIQNYKTFYFVMNIMSEFVGTCRAVAVKGGDHRWLFVIYCRGLHFIYSPSTKILYVRSYFILNDLTQLPKQYFFFSPYNPPWRFYIYVCLKQSSLHLALPWKIVSLLWKDIPNLMQIKIYAMPNGSLSL